MLLWSCESNRLFEENKTITERSWKVTEPVSFTFSIEDVTIPYNIYYNIRNTSDYPVSRIFIKYSLTDSTGNVISAKLDSRFLFDQKSGKPFGESSIGDLFDHQFLLLENYQFTNSGKYTLTLSQETREGTAQEKDSTLKGIVAVGMRLEYFTNKEGGL
jgi:gliding motility-associated lipoprotein GldH